MAFILIFFLVEETKRFELEELSNIFAVPKSEFVRFQLKYLNYLWRKFALRKKEPEPELYTLTPRQYVNDREGDESDESNLSFGI